MISKTELKILKLLFEDLTKEFTIRESSLRLKLPYPQTHRAISSLFEKKLIKKNEKGKSCLISLSLEKNNEDYVVVELERKKELFDEYKLIKILINDLESIKYNQFICILFGSYAEKKAKKDSDIDLLFVISEEYDYERFEKTAKNTITLSKTDINITTEEGLIKMWSNPMKLNVGNEILKKHVVLFGVEQFLKLRRKYYLGN